MPTAKDERNKELLQRLGVVVPPPGATAKRAQTLGIFDSSFSKPADTSDLMDVPSSRIDWSIGPKDFAAEAERTGRYPGLFNNVGDASTTPVSVETKPGRTSLFDDAPSGDDAEKAALTTPQSNVTIDPQKGLASRDARFAIDDLNEQMNRALTLADEEGYPDARKTAIRKRFKQAIEQLKPFAKPEKEEHVHAPDESFYQRTKEGVRDFYAAIPKVPLAEETGDIIAGDTREGQRSTLQKAGDVAFALANPIPTMIRRGSKAISDIREKGWEQAAKEQEGLQESGQGLREFTGDVVGGTNVLDAIMLALTAGQSSLATGAASTAARAGLSSARVAAAAPTVHRLVGGANALAGAGEIAQGGFNIEEGISEGKASKAGLGALQTILGSAAVSQGARTFKMPDAPEAKMASEFLANERRVANVNAANAEPTLTDVPLGDDLVSVIRRDARFGGSADNPLDVNTAVAHARNLSPEARELVLKTQTAPRDVSYTSAAIAERDAARAAGETAAVAEDSLRSKIRYSLTEAQKINAETLRLQRQARGERFGQMEADMAADPSLEGMAGSRGRLAGELPRSESAMPTITYSQAEKDALADLIQSSTLNPAERMRAASTLLQLAEGSPVPPSASDIKLLEKALGTKVGNIQPSKLSQFFGGLIDVPRTIMANFDLSGLRQGFVASTRHPILSAKAFAKSVFGDGGFVETWARNVEKSKGSYDAVVDDFINDPLYTVAKDSGLHFATVSGRKAGGIGMMGSEDWAPSKLLVGETGNKTADKLIGNTLGRGINASQRAYSLFLDKLRFDIFKSHTDDLLKMGMSPVSNPEVFEGFAGLVNTATGRGSLSKLEPHAQKLAQAFWSPRLMAARLTMMNPYYYAKLPPAVRAEAFATLASAAAASVGALKALEMAGASVQWDPKSADFGKVRIGNTRISLMGGHEGYITFLSRVLAKKYLSQTGQLRELTGEGPDPSRTDVLIRFMRGKAAPIPGFILDALYQKTYTGQPFEFWNGVQEMVTPMVLSDLAESLKAEGGFAEPGRSNEVGMHGLDLEKLMKPENWGEAARAGALWSPAVLGFSTSAYEDRIPSQREQRRIRREEAKTQARKTVGTVKPSGGRGLFD